MIVADTSAFMAILFEEPKAEVCAQAIDRADGLLMSAGTMTELLIVAGQRGHAEQMAKFLLSLDVTIVPVLEADARRAAQAHMQWGKGIHPAGLNFGDCFAYALAKERGCPLLYVGNDFAQTDIAAAVTQP